MNDEQPAVDPQQNLERPARKQVPGPVTDARPQHDGDFNVWWGRRQVSRQDRMTRAERREASKYRCHPKVDTGRTKGTSGGTNTFCRYFAKGLCYQGPDCAFLHRLPTAADNTAMARTPSQDIFGREKLPDHWDNRRGAGSYERDMTTLYVHYGGAGHYAVLQLRHLLLENFGAFGPVKGIHIVPTKTIAFVRFHWRVSAEFAHEAMDQQPLIGSTLNEVLSVKWANDDPNPVSILGRKRAALDAAEAAAMSTWEAMPAEEKAARIAMAQQARARQVSQVASALPAPLMQAARAGGRIADDSFAAWRGFDRDAPQEQDPEQQQHEQEQAARDAAAAAEQEAAAQWQAYYEQHAQYYEQQMYAQPQPAQEPAGTAADGGEGGAGGARGAWYQGWRQRSRPAEAVAAAAADAAHGAPAPQAAAAGADGGNAADGSGAVLGLLAGYGSGSDSEDDGDEPAAPTDAAAVVSHEGAKQQQKQQRDGEEEGEQLPPATGGP